MVPLVQVEGRKKMVLAVSEGQLIDWNLVEMPKANYHSFFHSNLWQLGTVGTN